MIQEYLLEIVIPFVLIFSVIYTGLYRSRVFGNNRKLDATMAIAVASIVVINHLVNSPYDIVPLMLYLFSPLALILIAAILVLLLIGLFGKTTGIIAVILAGVLVIVYLFPNYNQYYIDPTFLNSLYLFLQTSVGNIIVLVLAFVLIVWFVTRIDTKV